MDEAQADVAAVLRRLTIAFTEFERSLDKTQIIRRLNEGRFEREHYLAFLRAHRQQVKDGAMWMARAASNIDVGHAELRSMLLRHAVTEHRDYRLLEQDYVAADGVLDEIVSAPMTIGSEALSAWMFHEASKPNPFGLLGAMWIIEGLGNFKAAEWGRMIMRRLALPAHAVRFLSYHGESDAHHIEEFKQMLNMVLPNNAAAKRIVRVAQVTARLYVQQIEDVLS